VPGQEGSAVIEVVRRWAARLGTIQLTGDQANPVISVRLEGVDIERVLKNAEVADTPGARRQQVRALLCEALETSGDVGIDGILLVTSIWPAPYARRNSRSETCAIPVTWAMRCSGRPTVAGG
jgi:hypothetical protein